MDVRQTALTQWLSAEANLGSFHLEALPADASFRRYFRVHHPHGTLIAMDAPPERENCVPFVAITKALRQQGLHTPEIILSNVACGFLLITDFGHRLYLQELTANNALTLYREALTALATLQQCRAVPGWTIPLFTAEFMRNELNLFKEWYLEKHLGLVCDTATETMLSTVFNFLAESAAAQPQVFMHRDYHSANLMCLPNNQVGILDFQDAFIGPVTYDLVSLLRDCYIAWPPALIDTLVVEFQQQLRGIKVSPQEWRRWFDLMGIQRHLKALLTFARKYRRDGNPHYLKHIPRTLNYVYTIGQQYPECKKLMTFIQEVSLCAE